MSINNKLKALELLYEVHKEKFPKMPDYDSWTLEELQADVKKKIIEFNKENAIKNFTDARRIYDSYLSKNLINTKEHKAFVMFQKDFWDEY